VTVNPAPHRPSAARRRQKLGRCGADDQDCAADQLPEWIEENQHLLKPPVNNKALYATDDFIVQVVGGPNQRTDFHVDPYEEWFYQLKGTMHVNLMLDDGPTSVEISEGETWMLPRIHAHSPQRPEAGSIGMVVERIREPGTLEKFRWYCQNCNNLLYEVELQVTDIVKTCRRRSRSFTTTRTPASARTAAPSTPVRADHDPGAHRVETERVPVVDIHTHYVPRQWPSLADQVGGVGWPYLRIDSEREAMIMVEEREYRRIGHECWDAEVPAGRHGRRRR
jgi:3-hydroxyanthranilate 3,4-dioxygenase